MRFSVIVTTYNAEDYIGECIEALKGQTQPFGWECLIGDDASTDGTAARAAVAIDSDVRFRYIRNHENVGGLENILNLVRLAEGEILVECGGDDFLLPEALARIDQEYRDFPNCDATNGTFVVTPRGGVYAPPNDRLWWKRWCFCKPLTWRRELTLKALEEDYQLFLDPHTGRPCRYGWDVPLFWTAVARAKQVRAIGEVLYAYRVHGDNDQVRHREDQIETETRLSREFDRRLMTKMPWWSEKQKKDLDDAKDEGLARGSSKSSDPVA